MKTAHDLFKALLYLTLAACVAAIVALVAIAFGCEWALRHYNRRNIAGGVSIIR